MDKLFNVSKTAELLGVSRDTVYRWEKDGKFKFVKVNGFNKVKLSDIQQMRGE